MVDGEYMYEFTKIVSPFDLGTAIIDYVEKLKADKKALEEQLIIPSVSNSVATEYAEFCVRCDRDKLPLLCLEDYIKHNCLQLYGI